jgi:hypothetical protein
MGRLCYPTKAPGRVLVLLPRNCHGARRVWRTFCRPGTIFIEHYECRGTSLIGAANLSPVTNLVAGTGAVSRYKLSRSQKFITVQNFNCVQMRVSGCMNNYEFVFKAGAKAKRCAKQLTHIVRVIARYFLSPFTNVAILSHVHVTFFIPSSASGVSVILVSFI